MTVGYILDLDGVITDTAEFHYRAWKRLADEQGMPFTRTDNEALRGVPRRRSLEILLKDKVLSEVQMQAWMERKNAYYREFLKEITPDDLLPGVWNFLRDAKAARILLGLGSASKNAREVCERLGILSLFDAFGDGYSVVNAKPSSDIFIWVAGRFGLSPEQCIVFEDAEAGIEAALLGGFWTVGLGPRERVGKAHRVRESLAGAHVYDFTLPLN